MAVSYEYHIAIFFPMHIGPLDSVNFTDQAIQAFGDLPGFSCRVFSSTLSDTMKKYNQLTLHFHTHPSKYPTVFLDQVPGSSSAHEFLG